MAFAKTPILLLCCFAGTLAVLSRDETDRSREAPETKIAALKAAAARMPQSAGAHTYLVVARAEHSETDGAIRELEHAVQLDGGSAEACYDLGATWIQKAKEAPAPGMGDYYEDLDRAFAALRRANRLQANMPRIHDLLGWLYQEIGDFGAATGEFQQAVQADPESAQAYNHLGAALAREEHYAESVRAFEKAVQLNPKLDRAQLNLGSAIQASGARKAALE